MKLAKLTQPPFETTMMGVVKAVLDHHGLGVSDPVVYGGSGHAFMVNVHEALCPSSPYCWNPDGFVRLLQNLGLHRIDLGFFHAGSTAAERADLEKRVRDHLDAGVPCSLLNMDNQLILGYDDQGFTTARPWPKNPDYPPGRLTFGTWTEFGEEIHASFYAWEKREKADDLVTFTESLRYAVEVNGHPERFECDKFGVGPRAFENWAAAAEEYGASHGNWWNGVVWGECRARAAEYVEEFALRLDGDAAAVAMEIGEAYREISARFVQISDKEMDPAKKAEVALDVKEREAAVVGRIETLLGMVR